MTRAFRVACAYALLGLLWILVSDKLLFVLVGGDSGRLALLQTYKGLIFIAVTALLLFVMVRSVLREQAHAVLEGNQRFHAIFDGIKDPIFVHDFDSGRIIDVNEMACALYGVPRAQLCASSVSDLSADVPPYTQADAEQWMARTRSGEEPVFEWLGRRPDGELFWIEVSMRTARLGAQRVMLAVVRDIARRKRAELALAQSEAHLRQAQAVGRIGSWVSDLEEDRLQWSAQTYDIFGVEVGSAIDDAHFFERVHPDDRHYVREAFKAACAGDEGAAYDIEHRIVCAGEVKWVRERAEFVRDEHGRVIRAIGTVQDITERRALQDAQRELIARLHSVANASPVLFIAIGLDGRCEWVNERWVAFIGRDAEYELGDGWLDGVHPDDRERIVAVHAQALAQIQPYASEFRHRRHDGRYRWLLVQGMPRFNADGRCVGLIGSCLDVSRERETLEALWESEERLRLALHAGRQGFYDIDFAAGAMLIGGEYATMLGYPEGGLEEHLASLRARIHPDDCATYEQAFEACLAGETPEFRAECRMRTATGGWKWVLSIGAVIEHGQDGMPARMIGTHTDVDRIKRAEHEVRRFRFIVENASQEIYLVDMDGTLRFANQAAADSLGYSREELVGMSLHDLDPLHPPEAFREHVAVLRSTGAMSLETLHHARDGRAIPKEIKAALMSMEGEEFICGFAQDISARRQAQAALAQLNQDLETRVRERTAQLEAANLELESFSYAVSHDLKAPLRGISGYSQILLEDYADRLDDEGRRFLSNIRRGIQQMHELIEDMLAYSRMDKKVLEPRPVDAVCLLRAVMDSRAEEIARRKLSVVESFVPVQVLADRDGLAMVLRNLVDNALKFTRDVAEPRIELGVEPLNGDCVFTVRDNGIGFDMKYHDRIFEIFQRLHRAEEYPGTGVGLALVRRAVSRMGGRVWAESTPGEGACFHLALPCEPSPGAAAAERSSLD
ncbi:MAG: PAS domain S-box protein [Rhodocyclaceae bacterium]